MGHGHKGRCGDNCAVREILAGKRAARHDAIVDELRSGIKQRSTTIPSGKRYKRKSRSDRRAE